MAGIRPLVLGAVAVLLGVGCAVAPPAAQRAESPRFRPITARVTRPAAINLKDRGAETLGVLDFEGPAGAEVARRLADQLESTGAFRVLGPSAMTPRLMKAGVSAGWDATGSNLRWLHERTAIDALVVGRVEEFRTEERREEKQTLTLQGTGEFGFVVTEEGKLAYREKLAYRRVPLYCRSDHGVVAARYRVLDARRGVTVATVRHEHAAEVPSFCYRTDVPDRLKREAQERLLQRLFDRLNEVFLADLVPGDARVELSFEVLPGGYDAALVHRNELGILYASRGEWARAIEMWQDCLRDQPDLPAAHYNVAMALGATGRVSLAADHLGKAIALSPHRVYREALQALGAAPGAQAPR